MKKYDFNRGWTVRKAEAGFFPQDLAGEPVILPHDAMIWEKRSPDSPTESAGGMRNCLWISHRICISGQKM